MSTSRIATTLSVSLALALPGLASAQAKRDPHPNKTYVAVVIGISAYENMPEEVELDFARSDAATVAEALQQQAAFDHVFLLSDRNATKAAITEVFREKAAQLTGPNDVLLVYFAGHGIGSDLGIPTLLAYDSTVQNGHEDGFPVEQFATDIATWTRAGSTILVTDTVHKNQLDGIYFYGPSATQWAGIGPNTMTVSATAKEVPATDGVFSLPFADGLSGAADQNADGKITAGELQEYLVARMEPFKQEPSFGGTFQSTMVIADGVVPGATATGNDALDNKVVYGEHEVYAAKFVFRDGTNPTVQCRDKEAQPCDSSCYVRNFLAGPCTITAFHLGQQVKGVTLAMVPGKYDCGLRADKSLACLPPTQASTTPTR